MNMAFGNMCYKARKRANLTQEQAAELLECSPRTIVNYERGNIPNDESVAKLVRFYNEPAFAYEYLSALKTSEWLLPHINNDLCVSGRALQLRIGIRKATAVQDIIDDICCDDKITVDELDTLICCIKDLEQLAIALMGLKLLNKHGLRRSNK